MFDWAGILNELVTAKALWQANQASRYVYRFSPSCFCMPCWTAPKYVFIENNVTRHVEFAAEELLERNEECGECDVSFPLSDNYHSIDWYYDEAITFATNGMNADCRQTIGDDPDEPFAPESGSWSEYCDGSMTFEYDQTLYYPLRISMVYSPMIADAGMDYTFGCLTVYEMDGSTDVPPHDGECSLYTGCTLEPCGNELCLDRDPVCCDGRQFETGCDAECESFDVAKDCVAGECVGCTCIEIFSPVCCDGTQFDNMCFAECESFDVDECISGPCGDSSECICTMQYDPVCCDGQEYGNACGAECSGFDAKQDCESGPCVNCICPLLYDPVCCKGQQFDNQCQATCTGRNITEECQMKECGEPCMCTAEHAPVCCNGTQYGNVCTAECNGFDTNQDCESGSCTKDNSTCRCTKEYIPVCCDGTEYGNKCIANCNGIDIAQNCTTGECTNCICPRYTVQFAAMERNMEIPALRNVLESTQIKIVRADHVQRTADLDLDWDLMYWVPLGVRHVPVHKGRWRM